MEELKLAQWIPGEEIFLVDITASAKAQVDEEEGPREG